MGAQFLYIDLPAIMAAILTAIPCALTGSFLLLRRQAMMGDALSHVVLPGIVGGFMIAGATSFIPMMAGALAACLIAIALIAGLSRVRGIDTQSAIGIVFTAMFALGVLMLAQGVGARVHLDVQHALFGALELVVWSAPGWAGMPAALPALVTVNIIVVTTIILFLRPLALSSFDPIQSAMQGFPPGILSLGLLGLSALSAVAAFGAVGSILVVALFACPPATARMLTDRLSAQLWLSAGIGVLSAVLGYGVAVILPGFLSFPQAFNAAGTIAMTAGALQLLAMLWAPRHGALRRTHAISNKT